MRESQTAFALVQQLRPSWLITHGMSSIINETPKSQVYVSGIKRGDPSNLENVPRASIKEIQHMRGSTRYSATERAMKTVQSW